MENSIIYKKFRKTDFNLQRKHKMFESQ